MPRSLAVLVLLTALAVAPAHAQPAPTPPQPRGPFYPDVLPAERDNDLAQFGGRSARGEIIEVRGRVLDRAGRALAQARVEIWQTNSHGRYHHDRDASPAPRDAGFQGWGVTLTDAAGHYRFRTVRPQAYGGRTPHIHFAVSAPGRAPFYTQLYFPEAPENNADFILGSLPPEAQARLMAEAQPRAAGDAVTLRFDIVLP